MEPVLVILDWRRSRAGEILSGLPYLTSIGIITGPALYQPLRHDVTPPLFLPSPHPDSSRRCVQVKAPFCCQWAGLSYLKATLQFGAVVHYMSLSSFPPSPSLLPVLM
ncbi:hypothetical protein B0H14DRAFT_3458878 [Mycena olivaceomarginata]|nr:hypothetical protein B0H14DRAFT_3458878 [Mycena olivaceomarginata]